ncbi:dihydroorotate dehydrogenase [Dehalogenimonas etheniformans]|uniref:Dihydroorotate dehydrogenase n=1 Tax=Dehalogenimonas etheniformans TaxID=1536648 RepID=A0A2P5P7E6_9CHLR|nr:dihydroorotate dehydrogenase [Dehalogenimonas etheniformans]PPD58221.1 dihydroorotate dehydrogenase [Dehalogenimonas etheniformans]QNT75630.1 dihydroorotate dehydrogenase [Dehalogenimonas etheniformans]
MPDLSVQLLPGLTLKNPVIAASGTAGYGDEPNRLYHIADLGAFVCKGTTLKPRVGNPQPRIMETENGLLNAIGLQNPGVDYVIEHYSPLWSKWQTPVLVNIAGESVADYAEIAKRFDQVSGVAALEVNISCPNVAAGCLEFGATPEGAAAVTRKVKLATSLPVIVKLTPNTSDIVALAEAVENAGADAVSLINTLRGMAIDIKKRKPVLGNITGGLSGPAIKPVALAMVWRVAGAVKIPVIGGGGISNADDAIEFLLAGASGVEVGTAALVNPSVPDDIVKGIEKYMLQWKMTEMAQLIGAARR